MICNDDDWPRYAPSFAWDWRMGRFACPCCGHAEIDERLAVVLQLIRDAWGGPLEITSGWRCEDHNQAVGGAKDSYHLRGMAADVAMPGGSAAALYAMCDTSLIGGLKLYQDGHVHVDVRQGPRWREVAT